MKFVMRKLRSKCKSHRVEVSFNNFIDKDVQSMLRPLNLMQNVHLIPKYRIKDNFITPNSRLSNLVSLCGTILNISFLFYITYYEHFFLNIYKYVPSLLLSFIFNFVFFTLGYLMNFILSVSQTDKNVSFILKFQDVHRHINNDTNFKLFIITNWIAVIMFFVVCGCITSIFNWILEPNILPILRSLSLMSLDANILYAIRYIQLLKDKIDIWNTKVLQHQYLEDGDREEFCKLMFQAYANLLDCYDIYKDTFQHMVAYQTIEFFYQNLYSIEVMVKFFTITESTGYYYYLALLSALWIPYWMMKSISLQIALTLHCEKFYMSMNNVQDSCTHLLNLNYSDTEKKICKNIKRLHRARFEKMDACGIFCVDATFPIKSIAFLAHYTFVLLQFMLLS